MSASDLKAVNYCAWLEVSPMRVDRLIDFSPLDLFTKFCVINPLTKENVVTEA